MWPGQQMYRMSCWPVLLTPCTVFQFLSDKKNPQQQWWFVCLTDYLQVVVFMWKNSVIAAPVSFYFIFLANYRKLLQSWPHPFILCEMFFSQQDKNSDAITSAGHVSTGRQKLPETVSFTEMWMQGKNMQEAIHSVASSEWKSQFCGLLVCSVESFEALSLMSKEGGWLNRNMMLYILFNVTFTHKLLDYFKSQIADSLLIFWGFQSC